LTSDVAKATKAKSLLNDWTLNGCKIVSITFEIADLAANLRANRGGRLPDTLIVATALNQAADVVYSQNKDLKRYIKEIKICELP
jgi:predicted nucleic acid-binding protein